jgi:hypothetical protein
MVPHIKNNEKQKRNLRRRGEAAERSGGRRGGGKGRGEVHVSKVIRDLKQPCHLSLVHEVVDGVEEDIN